VTLVLCLALAVNAKRLDTNHTKGLTATPSYYVFALQQCTDGGAFSIHGLWPQWDKKSWPQYCNNSAPFNENQIAALMPQIEQNWPSCQGQEDSFLSHEWDKHGTCTPFDEYTYFSIGLNLFATYDWQNQCSSKGVTYKECELHIPTPTVAAIASKLMKK